MGDPLREWIATSGHTPGHVAYRRPADGVVLSGDALATVDLNSVPGVLTSRQRLAGPWYTTWDRQKARASITALAELHPQVIGPGHSRPLTGDTGDAFADPRRG